MELTSEVIRALVEKAPWLTPEDIRTLAERSTPGSYNTNNAFAGAAALPLLRQLAELAASKNTVDARGAHRTIRLPHDIAVEVIERIDRHDDPDEILSFAFRNLER